MSDDNLIELNDIILYNGNEEEFKNYNKDLKQPLKSKKGLNILTIYSNKNPKNKIYTGNLINGKYHGRGILYNDSGKIIYNGYFNQGNYEGYGKEYDSNNCLIYEGFFNNNNYNGKGNLYKNGIKIYEGNFLNGYYHGIGIEYLSNGNRKRKLVYKEGKFESNCYGILYDENNKEEYKGLLNNGWPKEGKSLIIYGESDYILYRGDFSNYKYNGNGILYFKIEKKILFEGIFKDDNYVNGILYYNDGSKNYEGNFLNNLYNGEGILYFKGENKVLFNGIFKDGKYVNGTLYFNDGYKQYEGDFFNNNYNGKGTLFYKGNNEKYYVGAFNIGEFKYGILYTPKGEIIYKGEFLNNMPKEGKNIKLYKLDGYLQYEGDFFDFKYHGYGKLYLDSNKLLYEGAFENGIFQGFGRLYEDDDNLEHYLYYEGNFFQNNIYGKGIKYYVNGLKKIEGTFKSINSYEGKYYNPKGKEIYNGKIINEIPMDFNNIILYNDLGLKVYDGNIYNGGYTKKNKIKRKRRTGVIFLSYGYPGKSSLIGRLSGKEFTYNTLATCGYDIYQYKYQYNNNDYILELYDTADCRRRSCLDNLISPKFKIIIYLFDLSEDDDINEEFINKIKKARYYNKNIIYLVGNKLDITDKNIEKYRKQAKKLIDKGKINKYFELSTKSYEGIDFFLKILKIDSAIIFDYDIKDPLNDNFKMNIEENYNLSKYFNF